MLFDIRNDLEARFTFPEHNSKDDLKISERILKDLENKIQGFIALG